MLKLGMGGEERATPHWRPQREAGFFRPSQFPRSNPLQEVWGAGAQEPACPSTWAADASPLPWLAPHLSSASLFPVIPDWVSELSAVGGSAESSRTSLAGCVMATEGVHTDADIYPQSRAPA